jgi:hypothetical protein
MTAASYITIAAALLRLIGEIPAALTEVERFWNTVKGVASPPPEVEAAMQAAFVALRKAPQS